MNGDAVSAEIDLVGPRFLDDVHAVARRIANQDVIKISAMHLKRRRQRFVERIGEIECLRFAVILGVEFSAFLHHANRFHLGQYAKRFQQGIVVRQQGLADMKTRMAIFFEQGDAPSLARKERPDRGPGQAAADHQNIDYIG